VRTTRAAAALGVARGHVARPAWGAILLMLLSKLVGLAVLLSASALLYDLASSPEFTISGVSVGGNRVLAAGEIEAAASATGLNVFWVRRSELSQRLRLLPPVESADVSLELPGRLVIQVKEREPAVIWLAGDTPFLVDRDGLVLAARPPSRPLMAVQATSSEALMPGDRVNADAVRSVGRLDALLTHTFGSQQRRFEYAPETGISVVQAAGPRLILGSGDELEWKVAAIQTVARHLEATRAPAELIDVRFSDRPYYR
jgi:cell division protein FtsQ